MKREREVRNLVERAGLKLVSCSHTGGNHVKATVQRSDGAVFMTIHPLSPSDWRGEKNKLAELKRFAAGVINPITPRRNQ